MLKVALPFLLLGVLVATVQDANGCCPDIQLSLEDVKYKIEDLRAKLAEQFEWPPSEDEKCPSGFTYLPSAKSCYKVVFETHDWYSAGKKCQELGRGSHLAAITSATENNALKTFLASELSKNVGNTACLVGAGNHLFWTSGQQQIKDNCNSPFVWRISSGKELSFGFTSWIANEPNCGSGEMCVHIWSAANFSWNDHYCNMKNCPLCEYTP